MNGEHAGPSNGERTEPGPNVRQSATATGSAGPGSAGPDGGVTNSGGPGGGGTDGEPGAYPEHADPEHGAESALGTEPQYGAESEFGPEPEFGAADEEEQLRDLLGRRMLQAIPDRGMSQTIIATGGVVNTGSVSGGQSVDNQGGPGEDFRGRLIESQEGPLSPREILDAQTGFAEPEWFPEALGELDSRLLFLVGAPGSGRRTAALNLLHRHSADMAIRAVDNGVDLSRWRPAQSETRGYLVDGYTEAHRLQKWMIGQLRSRLAEADARMVIVVPDAPELVGTLKRELHVWPAVCEPPPPRRVFDARLAALVPDPARRDGLLAALEPGLLAELLGSELVPSQVAELVEELSRETSDATAIRNRLSFLAEEEVPNLVEKLRPDPEGLAFLISACVFEGLDHRIVREEADRLLELADGRLHSVLPATTDEGTPRDNPRFVFRRRMSELVRDVGARPLREETPASYGYARSVEPVLFTRRDQGEAVLRHVWREYGQLSALMTDWLKETRAIDELTRPAGRVMGMATRWGGGRRALNHLREFAVSRRVSIRQIAAYALAVAAEELSNEVKELLWQWSRAKSTHLRSTVAYTCSTDYGLSRPDHALRLLATVSRPRVGDDAGETTVRVAVRGALLALSRAGSQGAVLRELAAWSERDDDQVELALRSFSDLLMDVHWLSERLLAADEFAELAISLTVRALDDDKTFSSALNWLLRWCRMAVWDEPRRQALEVLLSALAQRMHHGVFRLFITIDRHSDQLAGKEIAAHALASWRDGASPQGTPHGPARTRTRGAHRTTTHRGSPA